MMIMTTALITRGMVSVPQVIIQEGSRPAAIRVEEVKPRLDRVEYTETRDDLRPRILKVEEQ